MKAMGSALLLGLCTWSSVQAQSDDYDFSNPATSVEAFVRMRGDTSGKDSLMHWNGSVFAVFENEAPKRLFGFEGFNVSRMEKQSDGSWRMLTREYAIYRDPKSNAILNTWANPYTNKLNVVFHVQNDPVNQTFGRAMPNGKQMPMPFKIADGDVQLGFDVPLAYPNPIDPKKHPEVVGSATYSGSEHFGFFAKLADFQNPALTSVPVQISWSRTSPWTPWMKMGKRKGYLLFSAWGRKVSSFDSLAPDFKAHIESKDPKYFTAPKDWVQPNATTWSEYKRLVLDK
jgi:hypothetical protein